MNPVQDFLRNHYSDARLVELGDDCQSGKFSFRSCCCFVGRPTADHETRGFCPGLTYTREPHLELGRELAGAEEAEQVLREICYHDEIVAYLIPLIEAEIAYRGAKHEDRSGNDFAGDSDSDYSGNCGVAVSRQEA